MLSWKDIQNKTSGAIGREGNVTIEIHKGSFRLRWRQQRTPQSLTIKGRFTLEAYKAAINKAKLINGYLANEKFSEIEEIIKIARGYNPDRSSENIETINNLKSLWAIYKQVKGNKTASSTKQYVWNFIDNVLAKVTSEALQIKNPEMLLQQLREIGYSDGTLDKFFAVLISVVNLAIELGKFEGKNPYPTIKKTLNFSNKAKSIVYSLSEIEIIVQAFRSGDYDIDDRQHSSSYYANFVEFRFLTGMRVSEVIALTWDDLTRNNDGFYLIKVNKAKPGKELQLHTKTRKDRVFKSNKRLTELIDNLPKILNDNNLIFPSFEAKSYIGRGNFTNKYWKPIVSKLAQQKLIKEYLPFKDTRHTFITHLVDNGMHDKAIAAISGNSPEVINRNYYRKDENDWANFDIPEIY